MKLRSPLRLLVPALVVALCFGIAPGRLLAQGTDLGTIRGNVADASGAVIPKAEVTIVDLATNTSRKVGSNAKGDYEAVGLRPGKYKVVVTAPGFSTSEVDGVALNGSDVVSANAVLQVSTTQSSVVVTSDASVIHT